MTGGATLPARTLLVRRHRCTHSRVWRSSPPRAQTDVGQASECPSTDSLHSPPDPHAPAIMSSPNIVRHPKVVRRGEAMRQDRIADGGAGYTHKSLKGNNFAIPPRTTNTATAKFTMRLQAQLALILNTPKSQWLCAKLLPSFGTASHSPSSTHKMSEKSMADD